MTKLHATPEFRNKVLNWALDNKANYAVTAKHFGCHPSTVHAWLKRYDEGDITLFDTEANMGNGMTKTVNGVVFNNDFRVNVINWMRENNASYERTAKHFGIGVNTFYSWRARYPHIKKMLKDYAIERSTRSEVSRSKGKIPFSWNQSAPTDWPVNTKTTTTDRVATTTETRELISRALTIAETCLRVLA